MIDFFWGIEKLNPPVLVGAPQKDALTKAKRADGISMNSPRAFSMHKYVSEMSFPDLSLLSLLLNFHHNRHGPHSLRYKLGGHTINMVYTVSIAVKCKATKIVEKSKS